MILQRDQIVFCRIKAKCYWPAQIKQIKRGGGYDVHFINKDDQETQNKNESDIIPFEEGLEKFKGSKQQGIEEAIEKAKQMIEEQSNQKKTQKKSQQQSSQIKSSSSQPSGDGKAPNSNLTKRRNAQTASLNSIESQSSLEESSQSHETQPTKKQQTQTNNKGKTIQKTANTGLQTKTNGRIAVSEATQNDKSAELQQGKKTPTAPVTNNGINQKKNEKINEKLEQKNQKAEQVNVAEGKRTPTRSKSKQNDQKMNNLALPKDNQKPATPSRGKKQQEEPQEAGKLSKANSKQTSQTTLQGKDEKKEIRQSGRQGVKSTENETESKKPEKKGKKSNGEQSAQEDSKQNKREISTSSGATSAGNKSFQKKENSKIAPTSCSTASSKTTAQSKKIVKGENKNAKQNTKDKDNFKDNVKSEEISPSKKSAGKRGSRKSASKKKDKNGNAMETEEREQLEQNNLFKNGYYSNNYNGSYDNNFMNEQDRQNDDNNILNNINSNLINTLTQHFQGSPEFGQKMFGETVFSNNSNNLNFQEDISKGIIQNITNNSILSNLLSNTQNSQNSTNNASTNNSFKGLNVNNNSPFSKNHFSTNDNKENNGNIFSLNNSPFGNNDRKYFDDQDELNLAPHAEEKQQVLTFNQQQQILLNALKSGGVTQSQFEFYSQKLQNNNQNGFHLFDNNQQQQNKQITSNGQLNQNLKFNNIFASSTQSNGISDQFTNSNGINVLGNITNSIQSYANQQQNNNNKNSLLGGLGQQMNPFTQNNNNGQGMSNSMAQQSSILSFGVPKQEYQQQHPQLQTSSPMGQQQLFNLGSQGDFLTQNDIIAFSQGHQLQSASTLYASGIQTSAQPPSFASQSTSSQNQNNHSVLIPSPKFITKQSSGQSNLQISNNSSFKLSPQSSKQQKCEVYNQMKNKILPMLELKIKNKVYYENEKDMWLCEIVDCVRQLKTIPIDQIYNGEYAMLLEQIYDALLTIQESTKRNFSYVLSMIQRTMTDLDKKIIKHLHDYSRVRGEKYNITREDEIQRKYCQAAEQAIKIEDKDDSIEICSSASFAGARSQRMNYQNQVKLEPQLKQTLMSPPQKFNYNKENESTTKKMNHRSKNDLSCQNGGFFNNNNNSGSNNTTIGNITSTSMNQSINNDLFNQSISETIREINSQPPNQILDLPASQSLQKIVKEEVIA